MFVKKGVVVLFFFVGVNLAVMVSPEENLILSKQERAVDARTLLSTFVGNLMSRSYSNGNGSQIISVNLTNLLVLILLKALIFAAGTLGVGALKDGYYHRKREEDQSLITEEEKLLFLTFLTGSPGNNGCLQYVACKDPQYAMRYKNAGDALLQTTRLLDFNTDPRYEYIMGEVQEAIEWGMVKKGCSRFECNPEKQ